MKAFAPRFLLAYLRRGQDLLGEALMPQERAMLEPRWTAFQAWLETVDDVSGLTFGRRQVPRRA
jgi:hypothetical protein